LGRVQAEVLPREPPNELAGASSDWLVRPLVPLLAQGSSRAFARNLNI
jgi:hypothetical protein